MAKEPSIVGGEIRIIGTLELEICSAAIKISARTEENASASSRLFIGRARGRKYKSSADYSTISLNWSLLYVQSDSNLFFPL